MPEHEVSPLIPNPHFVGVAHHEAQMAALLAATSESELTPRGDQPAHVWRNEFNRRQRGSHEGWNLKQLAAENFLIALGNTGLIAVTRREYDPTKRTSARELYGVTETGKELGKPLAGAISTWSLAHPDLSTQKLLGGPGRTATARRVILDSALRSDGHGVPVTTIQDRFAEYGESRKYAPPRIDDFEGSGLLEVTKSSTGSKLVRVHRDHEDAVADFLQTLDDYEADPTSSALRNAAEGIAEDPQAMGYLMAKGHDNSPNTRTKAQVAAAQAQTRAILSQNPDIRAIDLQRQTGMSLARAYTTKMHDRLRRSRGDAPSE